jgi:3-dehydroquinate dehydratase/shikimate dehydrogenase
MALLCETVTATTMADLLAARDRVTSADMVELRLDGVTDLDVPAAIRGHAPGYAGFHGPVLATCRAMWEGGRFDGSEEERHRILAQALEAGAAYVDVEWKAGFSDLIARDPRRIVLSSHDFTGVPADLRDRARAMRSAGAGMIKLAVATNRLTDSLALREIGREGNAVVIGMGEAGVPTRLLATLFGSAWTYAGTAAPGQMSAQRMIDEFAFRRVRPGTQVYGVASTNALHSFSPVMHNAAFEAAKLDAVYVPFQATDFADVLSFASELPVEGVSVTIPFKEDALRAASTIDDTARAVGAVNTLRRTGHGWEATNTDVAGFAAPLETAFGGPLRGTRASVLGAGGSARAVVVALRQRGASVTLHARRLEQASAVVADLGGTVGPWPPSPGSWDLLVNCTPLGGAGKRGDSPLPGGPFDGRLVYDLTYGPGASRLVSEAKQAGCATLDGLPMLAAQAEKQFEWWTGQRPPVGVMEAALRTRICR